MVRIIILFYFLDLPFYSTFEGIENRSYTGFSVYWWYLYFGCQVFGHTIQGTWGQRVMVDYWEGFVKGFWEIEHNQSADLSHQSYQYYHPPTRLKDFWRLFAVYSGSCGNMIMFSLSVSSLGQRSSFPFFFLFFPFVDTHPIGGKTDTSVYLSTVIDRQVTSLCCTNNCLHGDPD